MAITHHPDISTLMTCAAGSQPESLSAVVASHLSMCPACFEKVSQLSVIGVTLFERLERIPLNAAISCGEILEQPASRTTNPSWTGGDLEIPGPIQCILGTSLKDLPWQSAAPGIEQVAVSLSPGATGELRLIRIAPSVRLSWCSSGSSKLLMALRGSYRSNDSTFELGDLEDLEGSVERSIVASAIEGCVLLMATDRVPILLSKSI